MRWCGLSRWTLPVAILTLGLFLLVINAAMFAGITIESFWSAVLASLIISIMGWLASWLIRPHGRVEVLVRRGRLGS